MNAPTPGLRRIHHDARSASKVELSIAPGDTLDVSDDVADQLLAESTQFKETRPAAGPNPDPEPPKTTAARKKSAAKKS